MSLTQRLILVVALGAIILSAGLWFAINRHNRTDKAVAASGTVEATEAQLGFQSPGRIEEITVHEGESVKAGPNSLRRRSASMMPGAISTAPSSFLRAAP